MDPLCLAPILTPHGRLTLAAEPDAPQIEGAPARRIQTAFDRGPGHGLLQLGAGEVSTALPPVFAYWREFAKLYVTALCTQTDPGKQAHIPPPEPAEMD